MPTRSVFNISIFKEQQNEEENTIWFVMKSILFCYKQPFQIKNNYY